MGVTSIYDFFLCYSKEDEHLVQRIRTELLRNGLTFLECETSNPKQTVDACRGFLYIASQNSYQDKNCDQQLTYGFNHRRPIIGYAIDQTEMPKDKKMAFSNSNILTEKTHPIETKLMTDLKATLVKSSQNGLKFSKAFWRSIMVSILYTSAIISIFIAGNTLKSVAVGITIALNIMATWSITSEANDKRKKYVKDDNLEIITLDCLLIIISVLVPALIWHLIEPSGWLSIPLVLIVFNIHLAICKAYEYSAKASPTGRISPNEVQQYFDVFISYSRKDTAIADEVCTMLDKNGINYFIDQQGIPGGGEFPTIIAEAIQNCALLLFLASENSFNSKYCRQEWKYAIEQKKDGELLIFNIDLDEDTLRQAIHNQQELKESIKECEDTKTAIENGWMTFMTDDWKERLSSQLKRMIPHTRNGQKHLMLKQGRSWMALMKNYVVRSIKILVFKNPLTSITLLAIALAYITGALSHSWMLGLGVYSLLEPILYYAVSHKFYDAVFYTGVPFTLGITIGMFTHSVWCGIGTGFLIIFLVVAITSKKA